jgi:hypothetical protein
MRNTPSKIPKKDFIKREKRSVPNMRKITVNDIVYYYHDCKLYNCAGEYIGNINNTRNSPKYIARYISIIGPDFPKIYNRMYDYRNCPTKLSF